jgi:regulator of sigma E protease
MVPIVQVPEVLRMDILGSVVGLGWGALSYLVPFLIVLTVVVFVHEMGHFLVARWCGVKVDAFSIGFGREIVGWNDRHGTRWRVAWIPLGGYVKFAGDENAASQPVTEERMSRYTTQERREIFHAKPVAQRAAIVAAGPIANFLLAIVIFAALYSTVGRAVTEPRVDEIVAGSAAEQAGFRPGDVVKRIDGRTIETFSDMQRLVATSSGRTLDIVVARDGAETTLRAIPRQQDMTDRFGNRHRTYVLGLRTNTGPQGVQYQVYDPISAVWQGMRETWFLVDRTFAFISDLARGIGRVEELGGPIRIAEVSGQAASISILALISLTAVLSVSIGLLNLFPIPMLDGGHLVFYAIEALRGRPLSERSQELGFRVGLALVLTLMVVATWNDISRLVGAG